jgi:hypothetical protein
MATDMTHPKLQLQLSMHGIPKLKRNRQGGFATHKQEGADQTAIKRKNMSSGRALLPTERRNPMRAIEAILYLNKRLVLSLSCGHSISVPLAYFRYRWSCIARNGDGEALFQCQQCGLR